MNENVTDDFEGGEYPLKPSPVATIFAFGLKQTDCVSFAWGVGIHLNDSEFQRELHGLKLLFQNFAFPESSPNHLQIFTPSVISFREGAFWV